MSQHTWVPLLTLATTSLLWSTAFLPAELTGILLLLFLWRTKMSSLHDLASALSHPSLLFLVLAFMLGSAVQSLGLSGQIAQITLKRFGTTPRKLCFSIFALALISSYFIQEHVVAAVLFPIVSSIADAVSAERARSRYPTLLVLCLAWGSVIGGLGTFLGGGRALLANALLKTFRPGAEFDFVGWACIALPLSLLLGLLALGLLFACFRIDLPEVRLDRIHFDGLERWRRLPQARRKIVIAILSAQILLWVTLSLRIGPEYIAAAGLLALLLTGSVGPNALMRGIPWQLALMYAGTIALGQAVAHAGLPPAFSTLTASWPSFALTGVWGLLSSLHTEIVMSNAATVGALLPLALPMSRSDLPPEALTFAVTLTAGLGLVLPTSTPAVALAFSTPHLQFRDLLKVGLLFKVLSAIAITAYLGWIYF